VIDMAKRKRTRLAEVVHKAEHPDPIDRLKVRLRIDKYDLDNELVEQPVLIHKVAEGHALAMSDRDAQKEYLKHIEGRINIRVRSEMIEAGTEKPTKEQIVSAVNVDPEWQRERQKFLDLSTLVDRWFALLDAYRARGYALHNLNASIVSQRKAEAGQFEYDDEPRHKDRRREATEKQS